MDEDKHPYLKWDSTHVLSVQAMKVYALDLEAIGTGK
jgi:hypothetical protein